MIRRPPRSTQSRSSAASDVYKRQLLTSLLTLSNSRLPQLAPLWAIGITRRRLAGIELLKTLSVALITALLALPLGLMVAWCLIAVVNVKAFGWRLPFHVFPLQQLSLIHI